MDERALAQKAAAKYGTRNPFQIAEGAGMVVVPVPLVGVRGLRQYIHRRVVIYINNGLDERQQRLVCAHELGHHYCHRGLNRIFMDRNTAMVAGKYENEAHRFALELLYTDDELQPYLSRSLSDAAAYMGVSPQLAEYRMSTVAPTLWAQYE